LSGTGKSTLGRALAPLIGPEPGAILLRSDQIRKEVLGVDETRHLGPEGYAAGVTGRVYELMRWRAAEALGAGVSVIADAVHARPEERRAIANVAQEAGLRFDGVWLSAPPTILERRVEGRHGDASDADAAVVRAQLAYELGAVTWDRLDAGGSRDELVVAAAARLGLI
jgi:predicted kinase